MVRSKRRLVTPSVHPTPGSAAESRRRFAKVLLDAPLHVAGDLKDDPKTLVRKYPPVAQIELFDTQFFVASPRQIPELRFVVAYLVQKGVASARTFARIFYKDLSLVWRVASHFIDCEGEFWIGKGALVREVRDGYEYVTSDESSTDLPFEIQTALETINAGAAKVPQDSRALGHVLRRAPEGRIAPYRDFSAPRERAASDPARQIHGGQSIAWFARRGDPRSLKFARGFRPDFRGGIVERSRSRSSFYHGTIRRFRILSQNKQIQYFFFAGPKHVWLAPPQSLETELSSYGVRLIAPAADDDLFVPGYEYHHVDPDVDTSEHFSQIPNGFAGAPSAVSPDRADASAWLEALPIIREFRRIVL